MSGRTAGPHNHHTLLWRRRQEGNRREPVLEEGTGPRQPPIVASGGVHRQTTCARRSISPPHVEPSCVRQSCRRPLRCPSSAQLTKDTPSSCTSGLAGLGADVIISTTYSDPINRGRGVGAKLRGSQTSGLYRHSAFSHCGQAGTAAGLVMTVRFENKILIPPLVLTVAKPGYRRVKGKAGPPRCRPFRVLSPVLTTTCG